MTKESWRERVGREEQKNYNLENNVEQNANKNPTYL